MFADAQTLTRYPNGSHEDLRMGGRITVRYSNAKTDDRDSKPVPISTDLQRPVLDVRAASTSVKEGIDFHRWATRTSIECLETLNFKQPEGYKYTGT